MNAIVAVQIVVDIVWAHLCDVHIIQRNFGGEPSDKDIDNHKQMLPKPPHHHSPPPPPPLASPTVAVKTPMTLITNRGSQITYN